MSNADETAAAVADIASLSKPEKEAAEPAIAGAVADVDAPAPKELREDQIENAVAFLAHPKVTTRLAAHTTKSDARKRK